METNINTTWHETDPPWIFHGSSMDPLRSTHSVHLGLEGLTPDFPVAGVPPSKRRNMDEGGDEHCAAGGPRVSRSKQVWHLLR